MAAWLTLKSVNDEPARLGYRARLEKASGYFYFFGGEATDWIDRTVHGSEDQRPHAGSVDSRVCAAEADQRGFDAPGRRRDGNAKAGSIRHALAPVICVLPTIATEATRS